jgi:hypothetical protein
MLAAWNRPTGDRYHTWRRHVKNHWFHVRLLGGPCADRLLADQHRLETLDGILGEYHNLVLLHHVLVSDPQVPPAASIPCLRAVSRYQRVLRQQAQSLGARIYSEKPQGFVRASSICGGRRRQPDDRDNQWVSALRRVFWVVTRLLLASLAYAAIVSAQPPAPQPARNRPRPSPRRAGRAPSISDRPRESRRRRPIPTATR